MFGVPSCCVAYSGLLLVIITSLGGKNARLFLIHSRLCGSEFGSSASGLLHILYSPLICLITESNCFA